jgi:hypothetical protein
VGPSRRRLEAGEEERSSDRPAQTAGHGGDPAQRVPQRVEVAPANPHPVNINGVSVELTPN